MWVSAAAATAFAVSAASGPASAAAAAAACWKLLRSTCMKNSDWESYDKLL